MKYEVVVGTLFIAGQKYRRGDIVELADASQYGVRVQPVVEAPKPEPVKKTRSRKAAVAQSIKHEDS